MHVRALPFTCHPFVAVFDSSGAVRVQACAALTHLTRLCPHSFVEPLLLERLFLAACKTVIKNVDQCQTF